MLTLKPLSVMALKCIVHISYLNKNKNFYYIRKNTFTIPVMSNLYVKNVWILASGLCYLRIEAIWMGASSSLILCWLPVQSFLRGEMRMLCVYYTAWSLNPSGSAPPRFLLLFFILSLQSLQVQPVWARTHIQFACVLWLQFRQLFLKTVFCVYLFICFEMLNIARERCR